MLGTGHLTGSIAHMAMLTAGAAGALAGLSTATASADVAVPQPHLAAVRHTEPVASREFHPQGGARRRSAFEPVRPKALTWAQVELIQARRADGRISAVSGLPAAA